MDRPVHPSTSAGWVNAILGILGAMWIILTGPDSYDFTETGPLWWNVVKVVLAIFGFFLCWGLILRAQDEMRDAAALDQAASLLSKSDKLKSILDRVR